MADKNEMNVAETEFEQALNNGKTNLVFDEVDANKRIKELKENPDRSTEESQELFEIMLGIKR